MVLFCKFFFTNSFSVKPCKSYTASNFISDKRIAHTIQKKKTFLKQKYKLCVISKYKREKLMKNRNKNNYNNSKIVNRNQANVLDN